MASTRRMTPNDLLNLNLCNLDHLTENYDLNFYYQYLMKWPSLCTVVEDHGHIVGYIMGKLETQPQSMRSSPHYTPWHGHITVLTVAPQHRRLGYARMLCEALEAACDAQHAWFVDLYVRASNTLAIDMYKKMGYTVYRRVVSYYADGVGDEAEDAFDMRKPCSREDAMKWIREKGGEDFNVQPEDVY